jgi:PIN domain nuclease of toxin-antitoxin system
MKKILIDTNIVLDFALQRQNFGEEAKNLIIFIARNHIKCFITPIWQTN